MLPGRLAVVVERTYRSENPRTGLLGVGWNLAPWESTLSQSGSGYLLTLADQSSYLLSPTAPGRWENQTEPALRGAVLSAVGAGFQVRFKDGTVQRFDPIVGVANLWGLATLTDRHGNTVTVTRVAGTAGTTLGLRIASVTEPAGRSVLFSYDGLGRVAFLTDPLGRQVRYGYDPAGRVETVADPAGGTTRYTYDASHRILTITDPRGITFLTNEYDANGRVSRQTQADGGVFTFAYILTGSAVTQTVVTDPRGNATTYRFNAAGFPFSQTDALGQTTVNNYAPGSNLLLSTTDALGRVTRFSYDATGNVTAITDSAGNVRTFTYEPTFNRVTSIRDPLGNVTSLSYDATGNLIAITDPVAARTTIAYNTFGRPTSVTDPLLNTTAFAYDGFGNVSTITDPLGHTTRRTYDAASRLIAQTDPRGQPTAFVYEPLNRLIQIADALGGVTRFSYDGNGNLVTVTDARGNTTSHTYDAMDRLATRTDALGASESFQYDGLGNRTRATDRKGQIATFSYDALNRRSAATYTDATVVFTYDAGGRLIQATDSAGGTVSSSYDGLDRLTTQTGRLGTVSYSYDTAGRRTGMSAPGQASITYGYDAASRLTQIVQGGQVVTLQYDAAGRRTALTLPNQVSTEYQYDAASRLTALIYRNAVGQLGDLTYQYDPAGNRTRVGGAFARTLLPGLIASASYDAANRQLKFGAQSLSYDLNGNLVDDGTKTYAWDARNRLTALTGAGIIASFQYDPVERRSSKTINGTQTGFLYDGLNPVQELAGATAPATFLTGLAIDEYLTRTDSTGAQQHFLTDALGSTVALVDSAAILQAQYSYEPFGASTFIGAPTANSLEYTGRENDRTGLYYYRARYYSTAFQRFVSEDPLSLIGANIVARGELTYALSPDAERMRHAIARLRGLAGAPGRLTVTAANAFVYADDQPTRFVDPLGLWYIDVNISAGILFGGTGGYLVGPSGITPYLGGGLMVSPSPASISVTFSWFDPTPGLNCGVQAQAGFAVQVGRSYGRKPAPFEEFGFGWPPGGSATCFWVF